MIKTTLFTILSFLQIQTIASGAWATTTPKTVPPILDENAFNKAVDPCENFYQFACGGWLNSVTIPSDKNSVWRQASDLDEINKDLLQKILEQYRTGNFNVPAKYSQKLGDYYAACMNPDPSESKLLLRKLIDEIQAIKTPADLARVMAQLHLYGVNALFNSTVGTDTNDSSVNALYFDQGGMALPAREYYFANAQDPKDGKWKVTLNNYTNHLRNVFQILGSGRFKAQQSAQSVLEFETQLATHALTREDRRDPQKLNNPMSMADFQKLAPHFDWATYLATLGISSVTAVNVNEIEFYKNLDQILINAEANKFADLKTYLTWQLATNSSTSVGGQLRQANFEFFSKYLRGQSVMESREKTCVQMAGADMMEALAEAYVAVTNGDSARQATNMMIDLVKETFKEELQQLDWLDQVTRDAAIYKLSKLNRKVGYPDQWKNFDGLSISKTSSLANTFAADEFAIRERLKQIGKPVDHSKWDMAPWEINAYYDPTSNEFVFPLAQLLPPSMDLTASDGANWGALGATLGHEMSHGYDDEGHQFDADGNLKNWWTDSVTDEFNKRAQCYVDQANTFEALPGLFVNGRVTLGENLADQGGTKFAYLAYKKAAARRGKPASDFAGYNEEQQFFLSYAQSWCIKTTEETLRLRIQSDPHPPAEFRVNMVIKNMMPFRQAFSCKEGTPMAPKNTCSLW